MYYKKLRKNELVALCKQRGLDESGNINQLVSRLLKNDKLEHKSTDIFSQVAEVEAEDTATKIVKPATKESYYLQIKSSNLSNYFNFGYFYPLALEESEIYKNENRSKDVLSFFEDYIIVGKKPFNQFDDSDVFVELVLNGIKVFEYESSELFYILDPIPISRVKRIYFKTTALRTIFLSSIKTFPDCFIPHSLCEIISNEDEKPIKIDFDKIKLPRNEELNSWKTKLDLFDKTLGLFAFIKNTGIFYAERENKFENFYAGFFGTLNLINPIKALSNYKENSFLRPLFYYRNFEINNVQRAIFKSTIERVYANKAFDIKIAIEILEESIANENSKNGELNDVRDNINLFRQVDKLLISYKSILQKEILRKNLPTLALLFLSKFSNKSRQNTDKQAVRNTFVEDEFGLPLNVAEYVLGFLGLYYGYKNMIKEDTNLRFTDKIFEQLAANSQSIKFKLESYFERFIVESAFQFAIHQKVLNDSFDFLKWGNGADEIKPTSIPSNFQFEYSDQSFYLMGQKVLSIIRQDKTEKVFEKLANQYSDKIDNTSYLATFFSKYFHFEKWHVLDMLKKNKNRYPINELEDVIDMDRKNKKR